MCCLPYSIQMEADEDAARWLVYHGLAVQLEGAHMVLRGQSKCHMLVLNPGGTTSCGVYPDRPEICRQYECERSKHQK
jgi:Fe-S-cluster containining protein